MSQYDPNNPYGQQPPPPPPPPPGPGPIDSGATTVFQPQQPAGGYPTPPGQPGGGYPAPPGQPAGGYPPAPGQQPPPGYPNQPGYGQPPGGGPNPGQRIQQLALSPQDWMLLGATVAMLLGLILDWYSERGFDANGFDDGVFPLSLGFLVAAIIGGIPIVLRLAKSSMPPFMGIGSREAEGVLGILMILGGLAWLIYDPAGAGVDKAIGLWLTILAAFVWGAGAIWRNFAPSTPPGAGGPTPGPGYGGY